MIQIHITKACAHLCSPPELLTAGMAKAVGVRFAFSEDWDGLTKTAVFTNRKKTVDVLESEWDGNRLIVPYEILADAGLIARVGVYGSNASGVVLPTVWVTLGKVQPAADPSGDPSTDPTLPVWAQLQEIIGDLADLTTKAKENLVAAINEAAKTGSGGAGSIDLRTADGYIQYSNDGGATWENLIALAELKGEKGEKGDTGATGPQGEPGERGPQGETGPQGPTGPAGPEGPKGATGPAGPDGAPGKDGSPGKDGADGAPGQDGFSPSASVAETGTGATITITDNTGTTTAEIKNGKDGAPGKAGTNGKDGADGADGTTFTPSVSAAGDLSWTNDGGKANPAPVNLKGPQGETGPQGPTGATGPQGAPGKDYTLTAADKTEIAAEAAAAIAGTSVPAPASAAVGQIVKVKAVDAAGKITQTEAVDLPTGGGSSDTWELITSGEMAEAAALLITTDADGAALALKSAQIIVNGATSFARATMLRFEVDHITGNKNSEVWAVEFPGDSKNDNPDIRAVYIAEQNKVPILNAESPADATTWASNACKVQFAKKKTRVDGVSTYSCDPLTTTINRIYVGNYMGNGKLGAGCKYQIWGIRA